MEEGKPNEEKGKSKFNNSSKNNENIEYPKDLIDKENNNNNNQKKGIKITNKKFQNLKEEETNPNDNIDDEEKIDDSINNEKMIETDESGSEEENENPGENDKKEKITENNIIKKSKSDTNVNNQNIIDQIDKTKDVNKENNIQNQTPTDIIRNNLKNDLISSSQKNTKININYKPPFPNLADKSSDFDPQYLKYIEYPEDGDGESLDSEIKGTDSIKASGAQIANTIMGAGILSIPIIMRYLGFLLGIAFIIFLAFSTIYSVFILIRCHEITGKNGFSMLGKITMGKFGSILIKIIIIINNLGFCIAYFRIFGEVMQTIIQGWVSPDSFWANNWHNFIYIIFASFIMFYFIFIKNLSALKKVAYMGVAVVLIFSLGIASLFFHKAIHHYLDSNISWKFLKPNCSFSEAFKMIPSVFLAFEFQFNVFPIYLSLKEKNLNSMMKATKIGVGYSLLMFLVVGIFGFLLYGLNMNDTLLTSLSEDMTKFRDSSYFIKFLIIIISVSFVITCLTCFPILFFSLRENFINSIIFCMNNLGKNEKNGKNRNHMSNGKTIIITLILYLIIISMAIILPKLKVIFSIVGATAGTFIAFILPNLFYIRICKMSNKKYSISLPLFFFGLGIFFLFISFIVSFT